jgi:hypothetical protein
LKNDPIFVLFQYLGERGSNTQTTSHHYDTHSGVMFFAEIHRNAIGCWNSRKPMRPENQGIIHLDNEEMIYPADLMVSWQK